MRLNIIAIGKLSKEYQVLFDKYKKKIEVYCKVNIIELKKNNDKNIEIQKNKETTAIIRAVPKSSKVIYCSTNSTQKTSIEFSKYFNENNITFIIGGSYGVNEKMFKERINFSKMTFPHQLFRVMLIEQIFRAFSIINNSKYHK